MAEQLLFEKKTQCSSCKNLLTNQPGSVSFLCPQCGKTEIIRCRKCREIVVKYKCTECNFTGPN